MPPTKRNLPSTHVTPLRRSSPRLLERKRNNSSHSSVTGTAVSPSAVTQATSRGNGIKHNKVPPIEKERNTNLPTTSHQRGIDIGKIGNNKEERIESMGKSGGVDAKRSLNIDFEKEDGSDTDSFVSTLGHFKDIDGESDDENNKLSGIDSGNKDNNDTAEDEDDDDNGAADAMSPVLLLPEKKKQKVKSRSTNYTELEDLVITKAFVSVSEDPINGSQQRANIFWAKVHQKYKVLLAQQDKRNQPEIRSVDSVKQRYTKVIAKEICKFNKHYILLKKQNKSGWAEDNYIEEAGMLYEDECNKPFNFLSCVLILHKHPKFDPMINPAGKTNDRSRHVNNTRHPQGAAIPRPIGTKKAKIVQYLKENGVVVGQPSHDCSVVDSSSAAMTKVTSEITKGMDRNYKQRERQMKLCRIDLYLKMNDIAKARELMKQVEDETTQDELQEERIESIPSNPQQNHARNPPMPPLNEIVVNEDVVESKLTTTQI
jgi:hypothetical protein